MGWEVIWSQSCDPPQHFLRFVLCLFVGSYPRINGFGSRLAPSPGPSRIPPRSTLPPPQQDIVYRGIEGHEVPPQINLFKVVLKKAAAPQKGGMMRDIATTAAGVAGGHLAANAILGKYNYLGTEKDEQAPAPQEQQQQYAPQQQQYAPPPQQAYGVGYVRPGDRKPQLATILLPHPLHLHNIITILSIQGGPCGQQLQDFINCTQNNYDISLCTGFNQALKDCKLMGLGRRI
eukprot:sb/3479639/